MKKITKTCLKIHREILDLYRQKPLEDITIKEVCNNLGIPRTTFYYHYDSVRAVLLEIEDNFIQGLSRIYDANKIIGYLDTDNEKFLKMINEVKDYFYAHFDTLEILLVVRPNPDFQDRWFSLMKPHYSVHGTDMELNVELLINSFFVLFKYAISNKIPKESLRPEKLLSYMLPILNSENKFID